ncbi:MAG: hypothetical protein IIA40_13920, partial [SAR324 cluster bacterium]|nr:hypothetical protein [SAR324 cluster bacterium]
MSTIYVLHENESWVLPLRKAFEVRGLPYEEWFLDGGHIDLADTPPRGVFYNRMSASSHTRGHRYAPEHTAAVLAWLEAHGRRVVNNRRALQLEISKAAQYAALNAHGIPTPKTVAAVGRDQIVKAARTFAGRPFITKHNRGGKGLGVHLFRSLDALADYVEGDGDADDTHRYRSEHDRARVHGEGLGNEMQKRYRDQHTRREAGEIGDVASRPILEMPNSVDAARRDNCRGRACPECDPKIVFQCCGPSLGGYPKALSAKVP